MFRAAAGQCQQNPNAAGAKPPTVYTGYDPQAHRVWGNYRGMDLFLNEKHKCSYSEHLVVSQCLICSLQMFPPRS